MQQRDFIKDEIERLGRVLGKLVTMMLDIEGGTISSSQLRQIGEDQFRGELGFDVNEILELVRVDLISRLEELNFQPPHLEQLGDFLAILGRREEDHEVQRLIFRRALLLYDLAGESSGTYSMTRADKEAAIWAELMP